MRAATVVLLLVILSGIMSAQRTRTEVVKPTTPADDAKPNSPQVPDVYAIPGQFDRVLVLRFKYQSDLLGGLEKMVKQHRIRNAVVLAGAGSVRGYHYHSVSNRTFPSKNIYIKDPTGPADIAGMNGYVIDGKVHVHLTLTHEDRAFGGHLEAGTEVFTFAVVTLGVFRDGIDLSRVDDKTHRCPNANMALMRAWLGPYGLALAALWLAGIVAARIYPWPVPVPPAVTAAFLVEGSLFLMLGFPAVLERLKGWPPVVVAISAVVPYCLYAAPGGLFNPVALAALFALASLAVLWFRILPRNRWMDLAFLIFVAAVSLARVFPELYAPVAPRLKVDFLGQLMWRRVAILSVLLYRPVEGVDLGWGPRRREWLAGLGEFAWCAPLGAALSLAIGFVRFQPRSGEAWELALAAAGIFLGMLWFVALTEEFFFRGLLQQWLSEWFASSRWGLIAASLVFGAAHLTFRYPPLNWRFALVAALAGFFYGRAFQRGGIRAAMVTHALVNVTWRMVFV